MVPGLAVSSSSAQKRPLKIPGPSVQATPTDPKKAMAGKRDFSEIVDLIRSIDHNDDKDDYPPTKEPRLDSNLDPQLRSIFHLHLFL
jgi:hypothetical protein